MFTSPNQLHQNPQIQEFLKRSMSSMEKHKEVTKLAKDAEEDLYPEDTLHPRKGNIASIGISASTVASQTIKPKIVEYIFTTKLGDSPATLSKLWTLVQKNRSRTSTP